MTTTYTRLFYIVLATLGVGLFSGFSIARYIEESYEADLFPVRQNSGEYTYINPLLECEAESGTSNNTVEFIQKDVEQKINEVRIARNVKDLSVYFRDLNNGPWFGINQDMEFAPASLTKTPILISVLKLAESDPGVLLRRITIPSEGTESGLVQFEQTIHPEQSATPGKEYSVQELLALMMIYSDNTATLALQPILDESVVQKTFAQIGVPFTFANSDMTITVRQYASFFRILYNASYLDREGSEYALSLMAKSTFTNGLVAGVPKDVHVAHKFGERAGLDATGLSQLHDCGVVYHPNTPYLLCVMTRGRDAKELQHVIQDVSKVFYDEIDASFREGK